MKQVPISYKGRSYAEGKKLSLLNGLNAFFLLILFRFYTPRSYFFQNYLSRRRGIKALSFIPIKSIVCDVGCGDGRFLCSIRKHIKKGIGFDSTANTMKENNIQIRRQIITQTIPLPDSSCDCVVLLAILEHFLYPYEILNESYRILRKGGIIFITTPTPRGKRLLEFLSYKTCLIDPSHILEHRHYFSKQELLAIFRKLHFSVIRYKSFQFGHNQYIVGRKS